MLCAVAVGLIVTGWQGFKDTPWEGFSWNKFPRSFIASTLIAILLYFAQIKEMLVIGNYGVILLVILSVERLIGDIYKGFVRSGSHAEYTELFRRLNLRFDSKTTRAVCGAIVLLAYGALALFVLRPLAEWLLQLPETTAALLVGTLGGSLSAIGGAVKDAQFEGFKPIKFIRSPFVGAIGGLILINFTQQPLVLVVASVGFERIVVEFYKTFLRRSVRGIFENKKPRFPEWFKHRWIFFVSYLVGVGVFLGLLTMA